MTGIVVAPHLPAAEAGIDLLDAGGSAVDAAIGAALVQAVVDPMMGGLGGFGVLTYFDAAKAEATVVDFGGRAGSRVVPSQWRDQSRGIAPDGFGYVVDGFANDVGYGSVGTPGFVAGIGSAHDRWGRLPWADLFTEAARLAHDGFSISEVVAAFWRSPGTDYRPSGEARLSISDAGRRAFFRDERPLRPGEVAVVPELATTLSILAAEGQGAFYGGSIGRALADELARHEATVVAADLSAYRPVVLKPQTVVFRDHVVAAPPPPNGGLELARMLALLDRFSPGRVEDRYDIESIRLLVEAIKFGRSARAVGPAPADNHGQLDAREIDEAAEIVRNGGTLTVRQPVVFAETPTTNQVTVVDRDLNVCVLTHSLGYSSGVMSTELGFFLNNYLNCFNPVPGYADSLGPGATRSSSMAPAIATLNGTPMLAVGAPGATRISSAIAQVIVNVVDYNMTATEAVAGPRVDSQSTEVRIEGRIPSTTERGLAALGHRIVRHALNYDRYFARPQLAMRSGSTWTGASDPRSDGGVALAQGGRLW